MLKDLKEGDYVRCYGGGKKKVLAIVARPMRATKYHLSLTEEYDKADAWFTEKEMHEYGFYFPTKVNMAEQIKKMSKGKRNFFCICRDGDKSFIIVRDMKKSAIYSTLLKHIVGL